MVLYVYDRKDSKLHWTKTELKNILERMVQDDILQTDSLFSLACSTMQVLEILIFLINKNVAVNLKNDFIYFNQDSLSSQERLLRLLLEAEKQFVSKRTTDALARRKAKGLHLGRPKGKKNKALKLDEHLNDIKRCLKLNISRAEMARLLKCHPQTLYDYITRKGLNHEQ